MVPGLSQGVVGLLSMVVLSVLPSLCFLGLVRGLQRLQDEELIERLADRGVLDPTTPGMGQPAGQIGTVACRHCQAENPVWAKFCGDCRRELR